MSRERRFIGKIVGGNLDKGVLSSISSHDVGLGDHLVILDQNIMHIAIVSDLEYPQTSTSYLNSPLRKMLSENHRKMLDSRHNRRLARLDIKGAQENGVKTTNQTLPDLQSPVCKAGSDDIKDLLFPASADSTLIGHMRGEGHPVHLENRWVQRSTGIFGATGSGKSFLTRHLVDGAIATESASVLIFDLHNEYGFDDSARESGKVIAGLKTKYPNEVEIYAVGESSVRGLLADRRLEISYSDVMAEDVLLLKEELNLNDTAATILDALVRSFGRDWFHKFVSMQGFTDQDATVDQTVQHWAKKSGVNLLAAAALWSKLQRLARQAYIVERPGFDAIGTLIERLKSGKHAIISFGRYQKPLDYLILTNILTRRLRDAWEKAAEAYRTTRENEPRQLLIVFDEAQNMLSRDMASQTVLGKIAREMRKNYVSLMIIAQQPSSIDEEVISQIGNRVAFWMSSPRDIDAVCSGLSDPRQIKQMISSLAPSQEAVISGWAMPMPIAFRVRDYK